MLANGIQRCRNGCKTNNNQLVNTLLFGSDASQGIATLTRRLMLPTAVASTLAYVF